VKSIAAIVLLAASAALTPAANAQPVSIRVDTPEFGIRVGNVGYGVIGYPVPGYPAPVYPAPVYGPAVIVPRPLPVYPVPVYAPPPPVIVSAPVYGRGYYPYPYARHYSPGHGHRHPGHHRHGSRYGH
jgi:hypothetical protein